MIRECACPKKSRRHQIDYALLRRVLQPEERRPALSLPPHKLFSQVIDADVIDCMSRAVVGHDSPEESLYQFNLARVMCAVRIYNFGIAAFLREVAVVFPE